MASPRPVPFLDVPLRQVMTPRPATAGPEDTLGEAAGVMLRGGFRHLPVVDPDGQLVGMLSERDLRERLGVELERFTAASRELRAEPVEGAMRPDPVTLSSAATVREAVDVLVDERIGALPVVDGEGLVGIVSSLDLLGYLRREAPALSGPAAPRSPSPGAAPRSRRGPPRPGRGGRRAPGRGARSDRAGPDRRRRRRR